MESNIQTTKKMIDIIDNLHNVDKVLQKKHYRNVKDIELYEQILTESNEHLFIILKNLKSQNNIVKDE